MSEKCYKGFNRGLMCLGKKYEEGKIFKEKTAEVCRSGMHYCKDPFDVLDHYGFVDDDGDLNEFAEVTPLGEEKTNDHKKFCTKKLRIDVKLSFAGFVKACVQYIVEHTNENSKKMSGYGAKIGSYDDMANIANAGNFAKIASTGRETQIGSAGDATQIGSTGDWAKIASSGYMAGIGSTGDWAKIASSGNGARINSIGKNSVICCAGADSIVSAKKGSWITLSEWGKKERGVYVPLCVKTEYVDGERIKEDTPYILKGGEFTEYRKFQPTPLVGNSQ